MQIRKTLKGCLSKEIHFSRQSDWKILALNSDTQCFSHRQMLARYLDNTSLEMHHQQISVWNDLLNLCHTNYPSCQIMEIGKRISEESVSSVEITGVWWPCWCLYIITWVSHYHSQYLVIIAIHHYCHIMYNCVDTSQNNNHNRQYSTALHRNQSSCIQISDINSCYALLLQMNNLIILRLQINSSAEFRCRRFFRSFVTPLNRRVIRQNFVLESKAWMCNSI